MHELETFLKRQFRELASNLTPTMTRSSSCDKMAVRDMSSVRELSLSRRRGEHRIELVSKAFDLAVSQGDEASR